MPGGFTVGLDAIVTGGACATNLIMIDADAGRPLNREMARFAVVRRGNMVELFTLRHDAVMAGHTGCGNTAVINLSGKCETHGVMTNIALLDRWNVFQGFTDNHRVIMTAVTIFGHAAKHTVEMAGLTFNHFMLTGKGKTREEVIEIGFDQRTVNGESH